MIPGARAQALISQLDRRRGVARGRSRPRRNSEPSAFGAALEPTECEGPPRWTPESEGMLCGPRRRTAEPLPRGAKRSQTSASPAASRRNSQPAGRQEALPTNCGTAWNALIARGEAARCQSRARGAAAAPQGTAGHGAALTSESIPRASEPPRRRYYGRAFDGAWAAHPDDAAACSDWLCSLRISAGRVVLGDGNMTRLTQAEEDGPVLLCGGQVRQHRGVMFRQGRGGRIVEFVLLGHPEMLDASSASSQQPGAARNL